MLTERIRAIFNSTVEIPYQYFFELFFLLIAITAFSAIAVSRARRALHRIRQTTATISDIGYRIEQFDSLALHSVSGTPVIPEAVGAEFVSMAQERRRLATIAMQAPIILYAIRIASLSRGSPIFISKSAKHMLGCPPRSLEGGNFWMDRIHPDDRDMLISAFRDLRPGVVRSAEYRLRHDSGKYVWVHDTLAVETDPLSLEVEGVGVLIDISDRKEAAAQLIQAEKMSGLGQVVAGVTHELNQPLNLVKLAAFNLRKQLAQGTLDRDQVLSKLDKIMVTIDHAASIVTQLRVYGRKTDGFGEVLTLHELLHNVLIMVAPQFKLDRIVIETSGCEAISKVVTMPIMLEQVLMNLLMNARDAIVTRQQTEGALAGRIVVAAHLEETQVVLTILDNGTGIPPVILRSIFEPYFTTKPPKQGTGLGLSISYAIIKDMGGKLSAANSRGDGARLTIELPMIAA